MHSARDSRRKETPELFLWFEWIALMSLACQKACRHDAPGHMYWTHTDRAQCWCRKWNYFTRKMLYTQKHLCNNSFDGTVTYWQVCHHRPTRTNHPSSSVACPFMSLRLHTALCWITQIRVCVVCIPGTETVTKEWPDITNPSCSIC